MGIAHQKLFLYNSEMKIYLDTSVYNRLYDDQNQPQIYLETQAVLIILNLIENQQIQSINSSVLEYENEKHSFLSIQIAVKNKLAKAVFYQGLNEKIKNRAKDLERQGIKSIDALHVASYEVSNSDYFITCDKRLLNRCKILNIKAINPIDFVELLSYEN